MNVTRALDYTCATPLSNADIAELFRRLELLHTAVPLAELLLKLKAGSTTFYTYDWTTVDGRTWAQTLDFSTPGDPLMTFAVEDAFKVTEFLSHREVRDWLVTLVERYHLSKVKVKWTYS